jgi:hypothetical protein
MVLSLKFFFSFKHLNLIPSLVVHTLRLLIGIFLKTQNQSELGENMKKKLITLRIKSFLRIAFFTWQFFLVYIAFFT